MRRSPIAIESLSSTTTRATSAIGLRFSSTSAGLASAASTTAMAPSRHNVPRAPARSPSSTSTTPMPPSTASTVHETSGSNATDTADVMFIVPPSSSQPLHDVLDMDLVVLVVAGQRMHHEIAAEAERHLALRLAARRHRHQAAAALVGRPGAGIVVGADHDGGDAVIDAPVAGLDPDLAALPASRHVRQKIERLGEHMVGRHGDQRRRLDAAQQALEVGVAGGRSVEDHLLVARVDEHDAAG